MTIIKSLASAFLMYSRIPMPPIAWKEENRRYAFCFFPLIGAVIGGVFLLWGYLCALLDIGGFLKGAVSVAVPLLITGGIHMDGFCDVIDARASYADKEKKLEIMSDPHVGSFALIWLGGYLLLQAALLAEADSLRTSIVIACGYVLSRALSGIAAICFKSAKSSGTLQSFTKPAHRKITIIVLTVTVTAVCAAMLLAELISGGLAIIGAALTLIYYRSSAYREFGGITGDLAGWFLQICELIIPAAAVIGEKITEVLL